MLYLVNIIYYFFFRVIYINKVIKSFFNYYIHIFINCSAYNSTFMLEGNNREGLFRRRLS